MTITFIRELIPLQSNFFYMPSPEQQYAVFCPFIESTAISKIAEETLFVLSDQPGPLVMLAVNALQGYLLEQQEWQHNFGLIEQINEDESPVIGKMFGVLVVRNAEGKLGYLAAFSGKLAGKNHHPYFVPPIFDGLCADGFLTPGMEKLALLNTEISKLQHATSPDSATQIATLRELRKSHSKQLQQRIFEQYHFLNRSGESKSLIAAFEENNGTLPPAGAGECAAPKLLQYAFSNKMEPLALTEFWWGLSPKSSTWKHKHFYAPCKEKCAPILAHMLQNLF